MSLVDVSKMLGHTNLKTTQVYAPILNQKVKEKVHLVKDKFTKMKNYYTQNNVVKLK